MTMANKVTLYERTIIFVQRTRKRPFESFAKYADTSSLLKDGIIEFSDLEDVEFGEVLDDIQKSMILPKLNVQITGHLEKLIISVNDVTKTDKHFYAIVKKFSDILVKEDIAGVGVNFNGLVETDAADELIKEKIIKQCPSILNDADLATFKMTYNDNKALFNVTLDSGTLEIKNEGEKKGIFVLCNYHREIRSQNLMKQKMNEFQDSLEQVKLRFEEYSKKVEDFLDE